MNMIPMFNKSGEFAVPTTKPTPTKWRTLKLDNGKTVQVAVVKKTR
jgi:hypothetical protein